MPTCPSPKGRPMHNAAISRSKYCRSPPFQPTDQDDGTRRLNIAESTMNGWFDATCRLLEPLHHLCQRIIESHYIRQTRQPCRSNQEKKGTTHTGFLWDFFLRRRDCCVLFTTKQGIQRTNHFLKTIRKPCRRTVIRIQCPKNIPSGRLGIWPALLTFEGILTDP